MIKVISENQVIASYAVYNKVNSIEELVALTKVQNVHFEAFASEDIVKGNDLHELGTSNLRVDDFCIEEGIEFEDYDTIDQDTEKVSMWFIHCNKNGFTPFWFVGFCGNGYEICSCKRTTLKSDLYVGQHVWFAHGVDIHEGEITQVCLRTESANKYKHPHSTELVAAIRALGLYLDAPNSQVLSYISKLKDGYVIVRAKDIYDSQFNKNKYVNCEFYHDYECDYIILPLDKVFTKSPF